MGERPPLSKAEMEVACIVWRLGEAAVGEVFEAFPVPRRPDYAAVQTYLRRLEAKGYLRTRRRGRAKIYGPAVRPSQVVRETVEDFVNRLFGGQAMLLFQHLIEERGISDQEVRQLRRMLRRWEDQSDETAER